MSYSAQYPPSYQYSPLSSPLPTMTQTLAWQILTALLVAVIVGAYMFMYAAWNSDDDPSPCIDEDMGNMKAFLYLVGGIGAFVALVISWYRFGKSPRLLAAGLSQTLVSTMAIVVIVFFNALVHEKSSYKKDRELCPRTGKDKSLLAFYLFITLLLPNIIFERWLVLRM